MTNAIVEIPEGGMQLPEWHFEMNCNTNNTHTHTNMSDREIGMAVKETGYSSFL